MAASDFNPRAAALQYAGSAERNERANRSGPPTARQLGETVEAVVCALVYIGDQLSQVGAERYETGFTDGYRVGHNHESAE